jgi:hypothetical protein
VELSNYTAVLIKQWGARGCRLSGASIPEGYPPVPESRLRIGPFGRDTGLVGISDLLNITRGMVDNSEGLGYHVLTTDAIEVDVPIRGNWFPNPHEQEVRGRIASEGCQETNNIFGGTVNGGVTGRRLIVEHDQIRGGGLAVVGGEEELISAGVGGVHHAAGAKAAASVSEVHSRTADLVLVSFVITCDIDVALSGALEAEDVLVPMGNHGNVENREGFDRGRLIVLQGEERTVDGERGDIPIHGTWIVDRGEGSSGFIRANDVELSPRRDAETLEGYAEVECSRRYDGGTPDPVSSLREDSCGSPAIEVDVEVDHVGELVATMAVILVGEELLVVLERQSMDLVSG